MEETTAPGRQGMDQRVSSQALLAKTPVSKLEKLKTGVEETSQWVKGLSLKHVDLSFNPRTHIVSVKSRAYNLSTVSKE